MLESPMPYIPKYSKVQRGFSALTSSTALSSTRLLSPLLGSYRCARLEVVLSTMLLSIGSITETSAAASRAPVIAGSANVQTITGRSAAVPKSNNKGESKLARKFKLKRQGEPWEVRIVTADGREQVYQGFRERTPRREARSSGRTSGATMEGRSPRTLRLHVARPP